MLCSRGLSLCTHAEPQYVEPAGGITPHLPATPSARAGAPAAPSGGAGAQWAQQGGQRTRSMLPCSSTSWLRTSCKRASA